MKLLERSVELPEVKVLLNMLRLGNTEAYEHSLSVASLVEKMLQTMDIPLEEKLEIVKGALLHDIGKLFVPLNLTQIPASLTKEEYDIVKVHASVSYEITRGIFSDTVQQICLYHHERPNGKGYLAGFSLKDIPPAVLIVQVADIYDALTTQRKYKSGYSKGQALDIMRKEARELLIDDEFLGILERILE